MRIAFYAPMKAPGDPTPSGDRRMARLLIEALEHHGATVDLASTFRSYDRGCSSRQQRLERIGGAMADRLLAHYRRHPEMLPQTWLTYHLYHKAPDHLGPAIARTLAIPYLVAEASFAPKQAGGPFDIGHRAAERAIRQADRIYVLNPGDAECLLPLVRGGDVLARLAPFVDTAPFRTAITERQPARRALEERFLLDPARPILLTVAMMRRDQKLASYAVLAEALGRIEARDWQLLVVGDGPAADDVKALFQLFGRRVAFAGLMEGEALAAAYRGADLFVWPSVKEAFGVAFIEAAAAGLAIVAGRSGGIAEIVEDGVTGLVVPAGDAAALAEGLVRLLGRPDLRAAMGAAGAERALRENDISAAARFLGADIAGLVAHAGQGAAP